MSNEITVRIKDEKDIKFKDNMEFQYSKDGVTLWGSRLDNFCGEVIELEKLNYAPDRWGILDRGYICTFRSEWFDVLSKKEIKEHYDSLYDFVSEEEKTSYIYALILKEAGVL